MIKIFLVAPYWSNVDLRGDEGEVFYEVHVAGATFNSDEYLANVSNFISRQQDVTFQASYSTISVHVYAPHKMLTVDLQ